ncbi:MAG: ABC transporter ATP-binding protein [Candidatus Krumholzibacteriia bacterium]
MPTREPQPKPRTGDVLLDVRDLCTVFETDEGTSRAVDGASFVIRSGEILGLVGESGCGKSVTALSILRLVQEPPGRIVSGAVRFSGRDLLQLGGAQMRAIRGNEISMVFQEPMTSLNPVFSCGEQVAEVLRVHRKLGRREAAARAVEMLRRVHLPDPEQQARRYPHQLSGGMRQRVMIAMALACGPSLLIADEPTTALDVTIQAQILDLLLELQAENRMAILLITHDLGVVAEVANQVAVMYAGRVVETGRVEDVLTRSRHPYTRGLLASLPRMEASRDVLPTIPGVVPHPAHLPDHCRFRSRCPDRIERCGLEDPGPRAVGPGHEVRCFVELPQGRPGSRGRQTRDAGGGR